MFWNKEKNEPESARVPSSRQVGDSDEKALDTLAAVLRSLGHHAFDLDDMPQDLVRESFEKWAQRLLLGEAEKTDGPKSDRTLVRDYGGARRFVEKHRKDEREYVVTALDNLRSAVRVFIQCTTTQLRAGRESDVTVSRELEHLDRALAVNDHATIRAAAERAAGAMRSQLETRTNLERDQLDELRFAMTKMQGELEQARREASVDALTQVFNRAALDSHLSLVADQAFLSAVPASIVMVDIDHFKGVNDSFGHPVGDEVLRQVADTIVRGFLRREDFVARYGGEEFCIVAQHTSFEATRDRAERLRRAISEMKIEAFGKKLSVSVSFGIAALDSGESAKRWLTRADEALYRAKQKGRNRISIAPSGHDELDFGSSPPSSDPAFADPLPLEATAEPRQRLLVSAPATLETVVRPPQNHRAG